MSISKKINVEVNGQIRDPKLRVVNEDGEQLGIMSAKEALKKAEEHNLDLVKIAPMANPPVVKIMDYGKYLFEIRKRDKENKKKQKVMEIKEIRLSVNIDTHDFETKAGHAKRFLEHGDKVKVSIRFRGREMAHKSNGTDVMNRFADFLEEYADVEKAPLLEGRQMLMFLAPKKQK
ncbi:MAG: translation initiation factor IF-3 [Clostridia bacterium]|nr:translation initiation factor IF-3 [Clostridia bacterium]